MVFCLRWGFFDFLSVGCFFFMVVVCSMEGGLGWVFGVGFG